MLCSPFPINRASGKAGLLRTLCDEWLSQATAERWGCSTYKEPRCIEDRTLRLCIEWAAERGTQVQNGQTDMYTRPLNPRVSDTNIPLLTSRRLRNSAHTNSQSRIRSRVLQCTLKESVRPRLRYFPHLVSSVGCKETPDTLVADLIPSPDYPPELHQQRHNWEICAGQ